MKALNVLGATLIAMAFCSCGSSGESEVEYIPVQEEENGNWGMVSPSGEMLFSAEFVNKPTYVRNGRFMVKNADGLWEIYTADEKPKQVGGTYVEAGEFYEDVAPVVEKGKPVELIDRDGNVKATLDKIDGKPVEAVSNFTDGIAYFISDGKYGFIDTSGKMILPAKYSGVIGIGEGKILVTEEVKAKNGSTETVHNVIDYKGTVLFKVDKEKFVYASWYEDDEAVASQTVDGETRYGIVDEKGEWVLKPSSKLKGILGKRGENFVYYDGDAYGLMNTDGEVILRAKYSFLTFFNDDILVKGEKDEYSLIDLEGNEVGEDTYENIYSSHDGKHAFVTESRHSYVIIDAKGNVVDKKQSFYDFGGISADNLIHSDYVDVQSFVAAVFSGDGLRGVNSQSDVRAVLEALEVENNGNESEAHSPTDSVLPDYYDIADQSVFTQKPVKIAGVECWVSVKLNNIVGYYLDGEGKGQKGCVSQVEVYICGGEKVEKHFPEYFKSLCDKVKADGGKEYRKGEEFCAYEFDNRVVLVSSAGNDMGDDGFHLIVIYKTADNAANMDAIIRDLTTFDFQYVEYY